MLEIDRELFFRIMHDSGLEELATSSVFKIFDLNKDESINVQEFLITLLALREPMAAMDEDAARFLLIRFNSINNN